MHGYTATATATGEPNLQEATLVGRRWWTAHGSARQRRAYGDMGMLHRMSD